MSDTIGRITVPGVVLSTGGSGISGTQVFPLATQHPFGMSVERSVIVHRFGTLDAKQEQRYYAGIGPRKFQFRRPSLNWSESRALRAFWEDTQGPWKAFTYNVPNPDGTTAATLVCFDQAPLSLDELDAYIFPIAEIPRPSAFITIPKEDCKDVAAISARIDAELARRGPVRMLQAWEEASLMAGSEVVGELAGIASGAENEPEKWREGWNQAMLRIMRNCGREFVGELGMTDGPTAYRAFCHSLIPLHSDKLERRLSPPDPDLDEVTKGLLGKDAKSDPGIAAKARINTMLHCSFDNLKTLQAGSVYSLGPMKLSRYFPSLDAMVRPLVPRKKDASEKDYKDQVTEFASKVIPVAVETSPACDHVQGNLIIPRLTAGYLIPMDLLQARLKKGGLPQSIWRLGPLWLSVDGRAAAAYGLLVNCLLVSSCSALVLKKKKAAFRIRSQAFATLQVCFASHAARPGMLLLQ
jgi:hypothetical protein